MNFTLTESSGTYSYNGIIYPMTKIIALGGTESNASGRNWWFSNQTSEYVPYSGIVFYQQVNTSYILNNRLTQANSTYTLAATNVNMGPPYSGSGIMVYKEFGAAVAVIAIAGVSLIRNARKKR